LRLGRADTGISSIVDGAGLGAGSSVGSSHHKITHVSEDPALIAYRAILDVPRELVVYVSRRLAGERRARGTRKRARALTCFRQALFGLVWFGKREDLTVLGAGFGISRATAYRYRDEVVAVLAAQAPDLTQALHRVPAEGWAFVILDGKIVDTDRCRVKTISRKGETIDLWYCGKRHDFGGNIQAVMRPDGLPIWVSAVEPGSVHDLIAAHQHALGALYAAAAQGLPTLADPGLRRRRPGCVHPGQATRRRAPAGHRQPHLQQAAAVNAMHR
jgi:hypothetical protein